MKRKIVEVEWFDAQASTSLYSLEEIKHFLKPVATMTIGYLLHETEDYIVIGFMLFDDDLTKHHQIIPRGMIKKITTIKEFKK